MSDMSNVQLYLAVGIPTFAITTSLVVSLVQISNVRGEIRGVRGEVAGIRSESREDMNQFREEMREDMKQMKTELREGMHLVTGKLIELIERRG